MSLSGGLLELGKNRDPVATWPNARMRSVLVKPSWSTSVQGIVGNRAPGISCSVDNFVKGKLEAGDVVHLAEQTPKCIRELLSDLDGSTVVAINGSIVILRSKACSADIEIHRKYFCTYTWLGHANDPCMFCGYHGPGGYDENDVI